MAQLIFTPTRWYVGEDQDEIMHIILEGCDPAGSEGTVVVRMHAKDMENFATSVLERVRVAQAQSRIIVARPTLNVGASGVTAPGAGTKINGR